MEGNPVTVIGTLDMETYGTIDGNKITFTGEDDGGKRGFLKHAQLSGNFVLISISGG